MVSLNAKGWLEKDGQFLVGEGRARLLDLIAETESLARTAERMHMSYRHVWGMIKKMEEAAGESLVVSTRGGKEGGRTRLTSAGRKLLGEYARGMEGLHTYLENRGFLKPSLTVDGIMIFNGKLVLVKRGIEPYKGRYALPGGFVEYNEMVEDAMVREIEEETGLKTSIRRLVGIYSDPKRDPRGHTVTMVFDMEVVEGEPHPGSDAADVGLFPLDRLPELAFDHEDIVRDFLLKRK
jgi:8-oxo-dGTP diphosphatase